MTIAVEIWLGQVKYGGIGLLFKPVTGIFFLEHLHIGLSPRHQHPSKIFDMSCLIENADGSKEWFTHDPWDRKIRHRTDGPAIIYSDGDEEWYYHDVLHRVGGPAVTWINGTLEWYVNGRHHREDGPAIEWADGMNEWFLNGQHLTQAQHFELSPYFQSLPIEERVRIRLEIL